MNALYWFCHGVIRVIADTAFRGEVVGLDNVPRQGPFLMASNHCSHLDPPLLGSQLRHQIHFFARKTLWKPGFPPGGSMPWRRFRSTATARMSAP